MLRFKVRPSTDGQWYIVVQAGNNETLLSSETYRNQADAIHAVELIVDGAATAELVIAEDHHGELVERPFTPRRPA